MAVALVGCLVIWHACSRVRYAVSGVKRTYRGGFVHRSGTQPYKKNIRFKEEKLARNRVLRGQRRLCALLVRKGAGAALRAAAAALGEARLHGAVWQIRVQNFTSFSTSEFWSFLKKPLTSGMVCKIP